MSRCKRIVNEKRLVCIGAMKHQITIIRRAIDPEDIGYTQDLTDTVTLQAAIKTKRGLPIFNGTNVDVEQTHEFYIRFGITEVEKNYTVLFDDRYFNVELVEPMDEEKRFMRIITIERGTTSNEANWQ